MKEDLLQYFWRTHNWKNKIYSTTSGQSLQIIESGRLNPDAGPDFSQARIRIDDQLWAGNVEIHVRSSEWYIHRHQSDPRYNSVILHVVWSEDREVFYTNEQKIPCLELKNLISKDLLDNYERLMTNACWIPCENQINRINMQKVSLALPAYAIEKLEIKTQAIWQIYTATSSNWEETLYRWLAKGFGLNVNGNAFEMLAEAVPLHVVREFRLEQVKLEAIMFGRAGLLDQAQGEYAEKLRQIFNQINTDRTALPYGVWKFFRTRPSNFPTIRLAQWIHLLIRENSVLDLLFKLDSPQSFITHINQPLKGFWSENFSFSATAGGFPTQAGKEFGKLLVINSVVPFMFCFGKQTNNEEMQYKALEWLDDIKGEKNTTISKFKELGFPIDSASQTQALLWLKKNYCENKRCLQCAVGTQIFNG